MRATSITRDHREIFTSKALRRCERFVGKDYNAFEVGIDDQYTLFYFSADVPPEIRDWVADNKYQVWSFMERITFTSLNELIDQINKQGVEFNGEECWDMIEHKEE